MKKAGSKEERQDRSSNKRKQEVDPFSWSRGFIRDQKAAVQAGKLKSDLLERKHLCSEDPFLLKAARPHNFVPILKKNSPLVRQTAPKDNH